MAEPIAFEETALKPRIEPSSASLRVLCVSNSLLPKEPLFPPKVVVLICVPQRPLR